MQKLTAGTFHCCPLVTIKLHHPHTRAEGPEWLLSGKAATTADMFVSPGVTQSGTGKIY
jgi:hypothetical protein